MGLHPWKYEQKCDRRTRRMARTRANPCRCLSSSPRSSLCYCWQLLLCRSVEDSKDKIPVFDLELLAKLLDHFSIQVFSIISNELSWYVVMANDVLFQESTHHSLGDAFVGDGFRPLGKVIDGHQNILMPIGGFQNHGSDDIHSPS